MVLTLLFYPFYLGFAARCFERDLVRRDSLHTVGMTRAGCGLMDLHPSISLRQSSFCEALAASLKLIVCRCGFYGTISSFHLAPSECNFSH